MAEIDEHPPYQIPSAPQPQGQITVSGTVAVSGPLTDVQLRAATVPVSGTVTASGPLTDAQLRATAVPVSGTFWQATQPVSGTFFQATQPVSIASTVAVKDDFQNCEVLADQAGAAAVLTFTFTQAVQKYEVAAAGTGILRVHPTGGVPSATSGTPVLVAAQPYQFHVTTTVVKVFAPATATAVTLVGYYRS